MRRVWNRLLVIIVGLAVSSAVAAAQEVSASDAWILMPPDGESEASAFVLVNNPTMYDVYVVSATAEAADTIELRESGSGEPKRLREITVPAYGTLRLRPDGRHLRLLGLKRALKVDENIPLTLTTDGGVKLRVSAVVKTAPPDGGAADGLHDRHQPAR